MEETRAAARAAGAAGIPWAPRRRRIAAALEHAGMKTDYIEAVDAETLEPVRTLKPGAAVLLAAFAGGTRLIDNTEI